ELSGCVERKTRAQIDSTGDSAFDHVSGLILVSVDTGEELRRDVRPAQPSAAVRAEGVTAVEFRADLRKAADDDPRWLGGEVCRITRRGEAVDGDAGNTLERFGNRLVGECADVGCSDRVDHCVGVALDLLRRAERAPGASDDDGVLAARLGRGLR